MVSYTLGTGWGIVPKGIVYTAPHQALNTAQRVSFADTRRQHFLPDNEVQDENACENALINF